MSIYENFPYQDVDNLNLDWILKKVKEASQIADEYEQRLSDVEAEEVNLRNDVGDLQNRASTDEGLISGIDSRVVQLETDLPGKQDKITGTNTADKIVVGDGSTGAEFSDITAHDCFRRNSGTAGAADGEIAEFYTDPADGLVIKKSGVNSAEITKKAAAADFTGNGGTLVVSNGDGTITNSSKNVTNVIENTAIISASDGDPIVSDGAGGIKVGTGGGNSKYSHDITLYASFGYYYLSIITSSSTPFTRDTLRTWLINNGYGGNEAALQNSWTFLPISGASCVNYTTYQVIRIACGICTYNFGQTVGIRVLTFPTDASSAPTFGVDSDYNSYTFKDKVREI